ncbi:MAG: hypothetical protein R3343_11935 [Nitriliruptorales bacterium]|nr:hypothetical protein [Nitriliruptorales bacterium]
MSTKTKEKEELLVHPESKLHLSINTRLFTAVALFAMVVGAISFLGGIAGAVYTWDQAVDQNITTPDDASIPSTPVRGPLTMLSQSAIITEHALDSTDGLYYAEMDRMVPQLDESGEPVLDEAGEPVMVPNEARSIWITVSALNSALGLGVLAYGVSAFAIFVGLTLLAVGYALFRLRKATVV